MILQARPPLKIYVINMEHAEARRLAMTRWLSQQGLEFELVRAVDGKRVDPALAVEFYDPNIHAKRRLSLGEVGCALSHRSICDRMVAERIPCALILEDDAAPKVELGPALSALQSRLQPEEPEVVLLTRARRYMGWCNRRLSAPAMSCYPVWDARSGAAYVITRQGAKVLRDILSPVSYVSDYWDWHKQRGLKVFAIVPFVVALSAHAAQSDLDAARRYARGPRRKQSFVHGTLKRYLWNKFAWQIIQIPLRIKSQPK